MHADSALPSILLISLGGTIADVSSRIEGHPGLSGKDLLGSIGDAGTIAQIRSESLRQTPSADLQFSHIAEVCQRIKQALEEGTNGFVITQGTDTLEEAAFLLDILLDIPQPVVVTGALRNPTLASADGAGNLLSAIRVAASPAAARSGVLVVMNDEIHAARFVKKTHTYKTSAFSSPAAGPLGWVAEDRVRIVVRPAEPTPTIAWHDEPPQVPLVTLGFATPVSALQQYLANPPAGLVVASLGVGHTSSAVADILGALAPRVPVILASRVGVGEIFRGSYGHSGSEADLIGRGCIAAGYLDPMKARILLCLLLAAESDRNQIAETFSHF